MAHQFKRTIMTYGVTLCLLALHTTANAADMEKCYGVAKAGMNDCDSSTPACDKSVIDGDPNYWIYLPKGLCNKLVGGMTMLPADLHPGNVSNMPGATTAVPIASPVPTPGPAAPGTPATPTPLPTVPVTPAAPPATPGMSTGGTGMGTSKN